MIQQDERSTTGGPRGALGSAAPGPANAGAANVSGNGPASAGPLSPPHVRMLQFAVVAMGVMILAGLAAVIGRVIYLASGPVKQAGIAAATAGSRPGPHARLALPAQSVVRTLALSGDRLAVHYDSPAGGGIAIVDTGTGTVLSRIELVPEVPH